MLGKGINASNKNRKMVKKTYLHNRGNFSFTSFGIFGSGSGSPDGLESPADKMTSVLCNTCILVLWSGLLAVLLHHRYKYKNHVRPDENS